jgi:DNA mismatch repair protein MSH4
LIKVFNTRSIKGNNNLCGILDFTKTKNGIRTLRSNILQPLCDIQKIDSRSSIIDHMCNNREFFDKLRNILRDFHSLDDMVSFCYNYPRKQNDSLKSSENKIQNIMIMNELLDNVIVLKDIIQDSHIPAIQNFYQVIKKTCGLINILHICLLYLVYLNC